MDRSREVLLINMIAVPLFFSSLLVKWKRREFSLFFLSVLSRQEKKQKKTNEQQHKTIGRFYNVTDNDLPWLWNLLSEMVLSKLSEVFFAPPIPEVFQNKGHGTSVVLTTPLAQDEN